MEVKEEGECSEGSGGEGVRFNTRENGRVEELWKGGKG